MLLILLAVIIYGFFSAENTTVFECQRVSNGSEYCKLTSTSYLDTKERFNIPVSDIYSAIANYAPFDEKVESIIILRTKKGVRYLTAFDQYNIQANVSQINKFLNDKKQNKLVISKDNTVINIVYLNIFLIILLSFTSLMEFIKVIVDKEADKIFIKTTSLFGVNLNMVEIPDVKDVEIQIKSLSKESQSVRQYRILLRTHSGDSVPLTSQYAINWNNTKKSADEIIDFLGFENKEK